MELGSHLYTSALIAFELTATDEVREQNYGSTVKARLGIAVLMWLDGEPNVVVPFSSPYGWAFARMRMNAADIYIAAKESTAS